MLLTQAAIASRERPLPVSKHITTTAECEICSERQLLTEANHRIANSLQLVSSILSIHAYQTTSIEARMELRNAAHRIQAIGLLHRRLSRSGIAENVDLAAYIRDVCSEIATSIVGDNGAEFRFISETIEPIFVDINTTNCIGIIVAELLTNCVKYAGPKPVCSIGLVRRDDILEISVSDDGPGLISPSRLQESAEGHGMSILGGLVLQANGVLTVEPSTVGARIVVTFPFL